jgi:glucosamine kinase
LKQHFFIGVDGGGTKSVVRVEDEAGQLLGTAIGGPANICLSVEQTWQSVYSALNGILQSLALSLHGSHQCFHMGMGLAGCESVVAHQAFLQHIQQQSWLTSLIVTSDAYTACLGAHGGEDGAIIIIGTGVVGYHIEANKREKVGGWGFPHDDVGGGAWLGLEAVKITLQWLDGRLPPSTLAQAIFAHFMHDRARLATWANQANATAFAAIGPMVIHQAQAGDAVAIAIMRRAAEAINTVGQTLAATQKEALPCSLVGGIAPFIEPYLNGSLRQRLRPYQATPDVGAVLMMRHAETDLFWVTSSH